MCLSFFITFIADMMYPTPVVSVRRNHSLYFYLTFMLTVRGDVAVTTKFEFESLVGGPGFPRSPWRSEASGLSSMHMFKGDEIELTLCLVDQSVFEISGLVYSNDGKSDTMTFEVDGKFFASFETVETSHGWGKYWNEFKTSGKLGPSVVLQRGSHTIGINVMSSDYYGTELDVIYVNADVKNESDVSWCETKLIKSTNPSARAQEIDSTTKEVQQVTNFEYTRVSLKTRAPNTFSETITFATLKQDNIVSRLSEKTTSKTGEEPRKTGDKNRNSSKRINYHNSANIVVDLNGEAKKTLNFLNKLSSFLA